MSYIHVCRGLQPATHFCMGATGSYAHLYGRYTHCMGTTHIWYGLQGATCFLFSIGDTDFACGLHYREPNTFVWGYTHRYGGATGSYTLLDGSYRLLYGAAGGYTQRFRGCRVLHCCRGKGLEGVTHIRLALRTVVWGLQVATNFCTGLHTFV